MRIVTLAISLCLFACSEEPDTTEKLPPSGEANNSLSAACAAELIENEYIVSWENGETTLVRAKSEDDFIANTLKPQWLAINKVRRNRRIQLFNAPDPVESFSTAEVNWGYDKIRADEVHQLGHTGQGVIVAVIDTGVMIDHEQLADQIYTNEKEVINFLDDDGNGVIDDINGYDFHNERGLMEDPNGHGTHVAGVISAAHDVGNVKGVAPGAKLMPLRFLDANGGGTLDTAVKAIQYAKKQGARVINASWGGSACSESLKSEIEALTATDNESGVLFVAASGNSSLDFDYPNTREYPAAHIIGPQIVVGASTQNDWLAGFSNIGTDRVNVLAPGSRIISTYPPIFNETVSPCPFSSECSLDGTSMAAPFVSGVAALLWSARPEATLEQIKQALVNGVVTSKDTSSPFPVSSEGRIDAKLALDYLLAN